MDGDRYTTVGKCVLQLAMYKKWRQVNGSMIYVLSPPGKSRINNNGNPEYCRQGYRYRQYIQIGDIWAQGYRGKRYMQYIGEINVNNTAYWIFAELGYFTACLS